MTELERTQTALFTVIRNSHVMPMGLKAGKSMEEINRVSYATMIEIYKTIDFDRAFEAFKQGKIDYLSKESEQK